MNMMQKIEDTLMYQQLNVDKQNCLFWCEVFKALHLRSVALTYAKSARQTNKLMRQLRKTIYEN